MSPSNPTWLPGKANITGQCDEVRDRLYDIFQSDFINGQPLLQTMPVWWNRKPGANDYHEGFWHLITRQNSTWGQRMFDAPRACRLPWCASIMSNSNDSSVLVWDSHEAKGRTRTYVWLKSSDYVVVLEKKSTRRGTVAFLVTAYHVDGSYTRRKLQGKYDKRIM